MRSRHSLKITTFGGKKITLLIALSLVFQLSEHTYAAEKVCSNEEIQNAQQAVPPDKPSEYLRANYILLHIQSTTNVVVLGDSLAQGFPEKAASAALGGGAVMNAGIAGFRSQQVLWLLNKPMVRKESVRGILLLVGTNNLGRDRACALAIGVETVAQQVHEIWPKARLVLIQVPPRAPGVMARDSRRIEAAVLISDFKRLRPWLNLVTISSRITDDPSSYIADHIHLSAKAYAGLATQISKGNDQP